MITAEGAGVIATIIPIGLLIVGFEVRGVSISRTRNIMNNVSRWYLTSLMGASIIESLDLFNSSARPTEDEK